MAALSSGTPAPAVILPVLRGGTLTLFDQLGRSPIVLAFFKISCPICQYTFPYLERLHRAYPKAAIYGISQNSPRDTERFCREYGITFPILLDDPATYTASNAYGLTHVPTIFYIAPSGTIEITSVGWSKRDLEVIGARLGEALDAPSAPIFEAGEQVDDFRAG